ncbi:hypothetical protein DYD21_02775 [Rhodohalobacter sp. SW132]|uniref:hypothetical protein n=1 Tax=Rhodohalobacter sp. SW132 TaxID=2293433 RepID=UPI000E2604B9|nr:hypothetical protein [Rhodohalobacter sp. SW132]REL38894.1 hypothetical protein DYD21_02775 [Rhodohalobacter sp. SW132]
MKRLNIILAVLFITVLPLHASAQTGIDNDRMDRDLRIMENVLSELFQVDTGDENIRIRIAGTQFNRSSRGVDVSGTYYPDYGVVFSISNQALRMLSVRSDNNDIDLVFRYGAGGENGSTEITEENVRARILEFFKEYAPNIGQLQDNDRVMVAIGQAPANRPRTPGIMIQTSRPATDPMIPEMIIWTDAVSLKQYRSGSLSSTQFEDLLQTGSIKSRSELRDFTIFASVIKTSLEHPDLKNMVVRRDPSFHYLPGMGVHFNAEIRTHGLGSPQDRDQIWGRLDSLSGNFEMLAEQLEESLAPLVARLDSNYNSVRWDFDRDSLAALWRGDSLNVRIRELRDQAMDHHRSHNRQNRPRISAIEIDFNEEGSEEEIQEQIEIVHREITAAIKDYASTLRNLPDDELLIVTLYWNSRHPATPYQSEIRIRKSDLLNGSEPEVVITSRS